MFTSKMQWVSVFRWLPAWVLPRVVPKVRRCLLPARAGHRPTARSVKEGGGPCPAVVHGSAGEAGERAALGEGEPPSGPWTIEHVVAWAQQGLRAFRASPMLILPSNRSSAHVYLLQADPYKRLIEAEAKGETVEAVVKGFNKGAGPCGDSTALASALVPHAEQKGGVCHSVLDAKLCCLLCRWPGGGCGSPQGSVCSIGAAHVLSAELSDNAAQAQDTASQIDYMLAKRPDR